MTDRELFDELNGRYFKGRHQGISIRSGKKLIWQSGGDTSGRWIVNDRTIELREGLPTEERRVTMLHEMCHIDQIETFSHGPGFLANLKRLEAAGEPGMTDEVQKYSHGAWEGARNGVSVCMALERAIELEAEASLNAPVELEEAKSRIALRVDLLTTEELDRLFPHVAERWAEKCADERRRRSTNRK